MGADDVARVEALQAEVAQLAPKAQSRFGGGAARQRIAEAEAEQRLICERAGVADLEALRQRAAAGPVVDPTVLDFARRELAAAEAAWDEVQALEVPEPEPEEASDDADGDDDADAADLATVTEIDLRMKPQAAS